MTDNDDQAARRARRAAIRAEVAEVADEEAEAAHLEAAGATDQPDQAPGRPTRDDAGNVTGTVHLADGTTETVDQLTAWADAFEACDPTGPTS